MKRIPLSELKRIYEALKSYGSVWVRKKNAYETAETPEELLSTVSKVKKPAKFIFLPEEEPLLAFVQDGKNVTFQEVIREAKGVIFGIPPCEAKAISLLDLNFLQGEGEDIYYKKRRENVLLFGLACLAPDSRCFCTTFGYGPFTESFTDIFGVVVDDVLLFEGITEKGKDLVKNLNVEDAKGEELKKLEAMKKEITERVKKLDIQGIQEKLARMMDSEIWDRISSSCLGCGACTYYCPTCYCFDIQDVERPNWGYRLRTWDSCMFTLYTLEGSGHNPRPELKYRWRNRLMHKFNYYPVLYQEFGCVGCGRCIEVCPVNIDIREILMEVKNEPIRA